jgi:hypothetical protein
VIDEGKSVRASFQALLDLAEEHAAKGTRYAPMPLWSARSKLGAELIAEPFSPGRDSPRSRALLAGYEVLAHVTNLMADVLAERGSAGAVAKLELLADKARPQRRRGPGDAGRRADVLCGVATYLAIHTGAVTSPSKCDPVASLVLWLSHLDDAAIDDWKFHRPSSPRPEPWFQGFVSRSKAGRVRPTPEALKRVRNAFADFDPPRFGVVAVAMRIAGASAADKKLLQAWKAARTAADKAQSELVRIGNLTKHFRDENGRPVPQKNPFALLANLPRKGRSRGRE